VAGLATALSPEFEVWEPLQRRSGDVELTVDRHVADLRAVAPDPATIVGHSWGAMLGLSYATRHPEAVRALVLVGCGTYDEASRAEYQRRINANLGAEGLHHKHELRAAIEEARDRHERDRLFAQVAELNVDAQSFDPIPDDDQLAVDATGHQETWNDVLRRQEAGLEPQSFDAIGAPVLMLHGDDDPHPGPMIRDALLPHVPQLEYVGIARCGHEPWRERHARAPFLEALCAWLRANDARRP
jgi:pimeloyl-ACP methyl ester carboxylesterase